VVGLAAIAAGADAAKEVPAEPGASGYLRVREVPDRSVALEVAVRTLRPEGGAGPAVTLVAVSHVGERTLYREIERLMETQDVVLYESVMPPGAGGAGGATDSERIESTRAAMALVAAVCAEHRAMREVFPGDIESLRDFAAQRDPRLADWLAVALIDAWGRRLEYSPLSDGAGFAIESLGADGVRGGEGADADLRHGEADPVPLLGGTDDGIQSALAEALGLRFQLDAIDYGRPNFRPADLAMDQLQRAAAAEGIDLAPLAQGLAGATLPARLAVVMLRLVRAADMFLGGAIADTCKVMLIEVLGDESLVKEALAQMGPGFEKVIVELRNDVVVDRIRAIAAQEPAVSSIAVLYGAAHMDDMGRRLGALGYRTAEERWLTALEVDLRTSSVRPSDLAFMRRLLRNSLR
jgi:hypothetical protein